MSLFPNFIIIRFFLFIVQIEDDALGHMKKMARTTMKSCYLFDRSMMRAWRK
jgi:hypothetical protein